MGKHEVRGKKKLYFASDKYDQERFFARLETSK
jgi:hypothetical protein